MRFIVSGESMEPAYQAGSRLFVSRLLKPRVGDVVVLKDPRSGRIVLKRIKSVESSRFFVEGDNPKRSTDSRHFGRVDRDSIIGRVLFKYW